MSSPTPKQAPAAHFGRNGRRERCRGTFPPGSLRESGRHGGHAGCLQQVHVSHQSAWNSTLSQESCRKTPKEDSVPGRNMNPREFRKQLTEVMSYRDFRKTGCRHPVLREEFMTRWTRLSGIGQHHDKCGRSWLSLPVSLTEYCVRKGNRVREACRGPLAS
jgi:hypothetical protein